MRIFSLSCPECGTVVAANELEDSRVTKCPGIDCDAVLRWEDVPTEEREHFLEHRDAYQI